MTQQILSFDSQILNTFQACARKTELTFVQNVQPLSKAEALEKGDLMHKMLEVYYSLQCEKYNEESDVWTAIREAGLVVPEKKTFFPIQDFSIQCGRFFSTRLELEGNEIEETIFQFREYSNYFQHDSWHPLAVEEVGSVILFESEDWKIIYNFKIDLIAEQGRIIAPFDHKTAKRREEPSSMSNQFIGYCFGLKMNNIVVNKIGFQKTLSPMERFNRYILPISDARIEEWRANTIFWAKRMIEARETEYYEMNLTSCDKYSGCIFRRLCESDPEARRV